ncbi:MAG: poly(R)-hydroxyalkanoic acid synthase subunit, partial [Halodesulfurarchaeum sp.]
MADSQTQDEGTQDWDTFIEEANEELLAAFERNVESQANFVEAWVDAIEENSDFDNFEDAAEGYAKAYQVWMEAAAEQTDRMNSLMSGEDVSLESFRDGWLNAANDA